MGNNVFPMPPWLAQIMLLLVFTFSRQRLPVYFWGSVSDHRLNQKV